MGKITFGISYNGDSKNLCILYKTGIVTGYFVDYTRILLVYYKCL